MKRSPKNRNPRSKAILTAYDRNGRRVQGRRMSLDRYYEGGVEMIDEPGFRRARGIVRIVGDIFTSDGQQSQHFEYDYSPRTGRAIRRIIFHDDGTVIE